MKHKMSGIYLMLMFTIFGCGYAEHNAAARTTGSRAAETFNAEIVSSDADAQEKPGAEQEMTLEISIGENAYTVYLEDNETAKELIKRLPMELTMDDLHGNEKYDYLPESLPAAEENIGTIHAGDLMLFGSDCLVLFYEDFTTAYSYTRIGRFENPSGLSETLGNGSVTVTFKR